MHYIPSPLVPYNSFEKSIETEVIIHQKSAYLLQLEGSSQIQYGAFLMAMLNVIIINDYWLLLLLLLSHGSYIWFEIMM